MRLRHGGHARGGGHGAFRIYSTRQRPGWYVVELHGPLDNRSSSALVDQLVLLLKDSAQDLVVDAGDLSRSSMQLANVLDYAARALSTVNGSVTVTRPPRDLAAALMARRTQRSFTFVS